MKALPPRKKLDTKKSKAVRGYSFKKYPARLESFLRKLWANSLFKIVFVIVLGMLTTVVFMMIVERNSGMYNPDFDTSAFRRFVTSVYYAIVTISTTGYGDVTPRTVIGRIENVLYIAFGMVFVAFFTATITSLFVERRLKEGWGMGDMSSMEGHFIICGWKKNMPDILNTIIAGSRIFHAKDIVVVANVDHELVDSLKRHNPALQKLNFLRGDYYSEIMLEKANVFKAKQIFILADESSEGASAAEIDSKTVMAAMTIFAMNKDIRMCAELLDMKYERYLINAHVDEIIYVNEYSRLILAISSDSTGISKVVNDILDLQTESRIRTSEFPNEYIGKTYYDLRSYFNEDRGANLIGLIENVGSLWRFKKEAIREAQKTPDISKLVDNLKRVKTIANNKPNLHPDDDYIVPGHSIAVVIERAAVQEKEPG